MVENRRHPSSPSASGYAFKLRLDKTPRQGKAEGTEGLSCVAAGEEGRRRK